MVRLAAALTAAALILAAVPAQAQAPVKVGNLDCDISAGVGMIIASQKWVRCMFTGNGRHEVYEGSISKFGVDIGSTSGGRMVWAVYAPTSLNRWALTGNYGGATAEATFGIGAGANVLVGGSNRTVSLQPLSFTGQSGLNVAGGVASLELRPAQRPSRRR